MLQPAVLALIARNHKKDIAVIALTEAYTFSVVPQPPKSQTGPMIKVARSIDAAGAVLALPVDSLTIVYGENGDGKTTLLLDICRSMHPYDGRPLGIIWRDDAGLIRLQPGEAQETLRLSGEHVAEVPGTFSRDFRAIFYTTSPFESARRLALVADGTIDASPSFRTNSFSGTSLCLAAASLPKDIPFIGSVRVGLEYVERLDLTDALGRLVGTAYGKISSDMAQKESRAIAKIMSAAEEATADLSPRNRSLLAIEIHQARMSGREEAHRLLLDLQRFGASGPSGQRAGKMLSARQARLKWHASSRQVQRALEQLKRFATAGDSQDLHAFSRLLQAQSPAILSGLQEAERLGLLHWEFLKLSSGQVALLMLFAAVAASLESLRVGGTRSAVLVIDEGEMFMHPAWQRTYLKDLLNFIGHFRQHFDELHLILATHSLIVAGDAPPNRLFDVKEGAMQNGFAYGPREVLTNVYGVQQFAGNISERLYEEIVQFLRNAKDAAPAQEHAIHALIEQIASDQLRTYLLEELQRRRHPEHA